MLHTNVKYACKSEGLLGVSEERTHCSQLQVNNEQMEAGTIRESERQADGFLEQSNTGNQTFAQSKSGF